MSERGDCGSGVAKVGAILTLTDSSVMVLKQQILTHLEENETLAAKHRI
jgi:hypothetical protein